MPQQHTQITNLDGMRRLVADLRATTPREPSADEIEDARRQQYEPPYAARWRHHQFSDESGRPTRSASSPVEARAWAGAATAAPARGASDTEMHPASMTRTPRIDG